MKALFFKILAVMLFSVTVASSAFAQVYPFSNPSYIPNLRLPAFAIASGVANANVVLNGIGTTRLQITGTCTSLNGRLETSPDGTNWVTLNLYPNQALTTASAVTSVTATGTWVANTAGANIVRFNNSAVSGTACVGTLSGSANDFVLPL